MIYWSLFTEPTGSGRLLLLLDDPELVERFSLLIQMDNCSWSVKAAEPVIDPDF